MDAFLEAILENNWMAKRDARTPWKTFYEAPQPSGQSFEHAVHPAKAGGGGFNRFAHSAGAGLAE